MASFTYSDAVNAARGAVTDDRVSQLQGYYNSVSSQRPATGTTSAYTPSVPTTAEESRRVTANQVLSNTTPAPAVSSSTNSNPAMPRTSAVTNTVPTTKTNNNSLSGSSSIKASTSNTAASTTNSPVTQTPATPSNQTTADKLASLTSRYYVGMPDTTDDVTRHQNAAQAAATKPPSTADLDSLYSNQEDPLWYNFLDTNTARSQAPATTPTATQETTPAAATPETATAETPKSTAYTPTTVRTTTATNNQSTTNTQKSTPATYTPTGMYDPNNLKAYNDQRVADIRSLYEQALQNSLAGMRTAYDQNMSDAQAARDQISPQYQRSMNALSAEYERQRRNNNMQAAANGLNTGAGSQMALAQSANYQANQAGLSARENEALNEANRRIGDLQRNYQNAIAEATANNNYKLAASLLDEYQNAYKRQMDIENTNYQRAQQIDQQNYTRSWNEDEREYSRGVDEANRKAQYGDFSGYAALYGDDAARLMEQTWAMQNPYQAWASGKLSAEDFYAITGKLPANPADVADQLAAYGYTGSPSENSLRGSFNGDYGDFDSYDEMASYWGGEKAIQYMTDMGLDPTKKPSGSYTARRSSRGFDGMRSNLGKFINMGTDAAKKNTKRYYGRGYSASRDKAYRGAPGYLNSDGQFVVPTYGWNTDNTTAARGHEGDKEYAEAYRDALNYYKGDRTAATLGAQGYVTDVGTVKKS